MQMIPMCDGHFCLMKTRRDGTVICFFIVRHHVGASLMLAGEIAKGKAYFDLAI